MTMNTHPKTLALAYYVAGRATADWLSGANPISLRRWDAPLTNPDASIKQCRGLARLGTDLRPIKTSPVEPTIEFDRYNVLNQIFVTHAGSGALFGADEEALPSMIFHTMCMEDTAQAMRLLSSFSLTWDEKVRLVHNVHIGVSTAFLSDRISLSIRELAYLIVEEGVVSDADGSLRAHFARHLFDCRPPSSEGVFSVIDGEILFPTEAWHATAIKLRRKVA